MSYDLDVYTCSCLDRARLAGLVENVPGLRAAGDEGDSAGTLTVVRGTRGTYCCTVSGPDAVDAEDVPEEVTAVVLGARWLYTVNVEGSAPASIPHAVRLARHLAQHLDGAVVDQREGTVWSRSKGRQVARPARQSRISTIEVDWYCLRKDLAADPARIFCSAAARLLPEAQPRRFGDVSPMQGKFAETGADGFSAAWHAADSLLHFEGTGPFYYGALYDTSTRPRHQIWRMILHCHADPFADERWRGALKTLFVALADQLPAFYATAQVVRGKVWDGRDMFTGSDTEKTCYLIGRWHWDGLSPIPVWWEWFGPPYRDLVRGHLPAAGTTATATGLLQEWADHPADRDELTAAARRNLPADLLATLRPNPRNLSTYPLITAARIPAELADPRPTIRASGTPLADWGEYELASPWAQGAWAQLPRREARSLYNKLIADKPARIQMLRQLLAASRVTLDESDQGIQALNDWFADHIEPDTATPGELSPRWYSVAADVALFLGDVITGRCPAVRWTLHTRGKQDRNYHQPVLTGFTDWPREFSPAWTVDDYGHQIIGSRGSIRQRGTITVNGLQIDLDAIAQAERPRPDEIYADKFVQTVTHFTRETPDHGT